MKLSYNWLKWYIPEAPSPEKLAEIFDHHLCEVESLDKLKIEGEEDTIFEMASAGFESTVRLAKSNPSMWVPIFQQNRDNILDVLNEHITQLKKFKSCLEKENYSYLLELIQSANKIRKVLREK